MNTYILPVPPSANRWWRRGKHHTYKSKEAREYQANVPRWLAMQGWSIEECLPLEYGVGIRLIWWRGVHGGDLDKRIGIVWDALQGLLYSNDSQLRESSEEVFDVRYNPHIEIHVWRSFKPARVERRV